MIVNPLELLLKYRVLTFEELSRLTGRARGVLEGMVNELRGDLIVEGDLIKVKNPVNLALRLVESGVSPTRVSGLISWRDFEELAGEVMSRHSYEVVGNMLVTKPVRFQIDVFGVDEASGRALAVDCKHWSRTTRIGLEDAGRKHLERIGKLRKYKSVVAAKYPTLRKAREVVGVILTLTKPALRTASNSIVFVSISEFNLFLREIEVVLEELAVKPINLQ